MTSKERRQAGSSREKDRAIQTGSIWQVMLELRSHQCAMVTHPVTLGLL